MRIKFLISLAVCSLTSAVGSNQDPLKPVDELTISKAGIKTLQGFEGCMLNPYKDEAGHWTIGRGHLITDSERDNLMKPITQEQADAIFNADLENMAILAVRKHVKVPLRQCQFDALTSFAFNFGETKFAGSDLVKTFLSEGQYQEAATEFLLWVNKRDGGGKLVLVDGLVKRRAAEHAIYADSLNFYQGLPEKQLTRYNNLRQPLKNEIVQIYNTYKANRLQ